MEDCHFIVQLSEKLTLMGVCDGHGGPEVAHYIAKHFPAELVGQASFKKKKYQKALQNVCKRIDNMLLT